MSWPLWTPRTTKLHLPFSSREDVTQRGFSSICLYLCFAAPTLIAMHTHFSGFKTDWATLMSSRLNKEEDVWNVVSQGSCEIFLGSRGLWGDSNEGVPIRLEGEPVVWRGPWILESPLRFSDGTDPWGVLLVNKGVPGVPEGRSSRNTTRTFMHPGRSFMDSCKVKGLHGSFKEFG